MEDPLSAQQQQGTDDLLPVVKKNFNARRTLHKAIDTVRAINKLREGGGLMSGNMEGAMSLDPRPKKEDVQGSKVMDEQGKSVQGDGARGGNLSHHDDDAMDIDSRGNGHGQTEDQIRRQQQKVHESMMQTYQARNQNRAGQ